MDKLTQGVADFFALDTADVSGWISVNKGDVIVAFPFACESKWSGLREALNALGITADNVQFTTEIEAKKALKPRVPGIKNIIAVASGKGGVGKSATSVNLAYALMQEGAKVGILDADIYGPSVPVMLGNPDSHLESDDGKHMFPVNVEGVYANSIGYLVPSENATVWRGPMASRAFQQLLNETRWGELDYLIVDMPPGTGDIQLTLSQAMPVTGAIVVTTPQNLALADAVKGIAMFEKVDVPVLGLIENMSFYQCGQCGHQEHIFDNGGGESLANKYDTQLLGALPLDTQIRQHADAGKPLLVREKDAAISVEYRRIARRLSLNLAMLGDKDNDNRIPIVEKH
ncbi:iron-sulfur cluster carrier protein ApbC [Fluctibacter corallii]